MSCNFSEIYKKLVESSTQLSTASTMKIDEKETNPQQQFKSSSEHSIYSDVSLLTQNNDLFKHFLMKEGRIFNASDINFVFVDGKYQMDPIEYTKQAKFTQEIHDNLFRKGYRSVFPVQGYAWNLLVRGNSMTIISQKCSGKTLAYLPALLTLLSDIDLDDETSIGPYAVIFASSSHEVEIIYKLCREFVNLGKTSIVMASGKWNLNEKQFKLLNGCHLLITTPPCFVRLVTEIDDVKVFNKEKLKHLVFDNFNEICEKYKDSLLEVLKLCTYSHENKDQNPQIIVTATKWLDMVASVQKLALYPTVVIADHIEAAIYAKSRFIITRLTLQEKRKQLLTRLASGEFRKVRTIIFVSDQNELEFVRDICKYNSIEFIVISSASKTSVDEVWRKTDGYIKLVLATDDAMINYTIKNAQILIHFSLPKSWTIFTKRFASCFNYYKSFIASNFEGFVPTAVVMMDQDNIIEVPRMISFLRDHRLVKGPHQMSKEILEFVEVILLQKF